MCVCVSVGRQTGRFGCMYYVCMYMYACIHVGVQVCVWMHVHALIQVSRQRGR